MKMLKNALAASMLAVIAGAVVFFATRPSDGVAVETEIVDEENKDTRIFEGDDARPVPSETGPHPKIVCEQSHHEFGMMELHTERSHTFEIRNDGEADLVMKTGTPTCKCTDFTLSTKVLKPGETGKVFLTWKPVAESQLFAQRAPIHTNDPSAPKDGFWLHIEGQVASPIMIRPENTWDLQQISDDRPTEFRGVVVSRLMKEFEIVDLECNDEFVSLETVPVPEDRIGEIVGALSGYEIVLTISPEVPLGTYKREIKFKVAGEGQLNPDAVYKVALVGNKLGPVEFLPLFGTRFDADQGLISLGEISAEEGRKGKMLVFITTRDGAPEFEVTDIEVNPPFLKFEMVKSKSSNADKLRYELRFEIPPGSPKGSRQGKRAATLKIKTNHPRAAEIPLRFSYFAI